jgi:hypothetical protein
VFWSGYRRYVTARRRQLDHRRRTVSLAATGAVLGTAAGVIAIAPGQAAHRSHAAQPAITLTARERVLYRLSSVAARQPEGQGRYVVLSEKEDGNLDTSVIDSITGDMRSYQKGSDGAPSGAGPVERHWSSTAAQFAAMPAGQAALRARLIAQYDQQWRQAQMRVSALRARHMPKDRGPQGSADDKVFEQATTMLWNPLVPPTLRSALFKVLAATPGVTVSASAHDTAGRSAVEISRTDSVSKVIFAAFENPATGGVLELTQTDPANSGEARLITPLGPTPPLLATTWSCPSPAPARSRPIPTVADNHARHPFRSARHQVWCTPLPTSAGVPPISTL